MPVWWDGCFGKGIAVGRSGKVGEVPGARREVVSRSGAAHAALCSEGVGGVGVGPTGVDRTRQGRAGQDRSGRSHMARAQHEKW